MTTRMLRLAPVVLLLLAPDTVSAQTAEAVIERSLIALGGREAHARLVSRSMTGTITVTTPGGDIGGSIAIMSTLPNKTRTLITMDLTKLGAGQMTVDSRFDGETGYVLDSMQGNRELTGNQLDNLRNGAFPHLFVHYKTLGLPARLAGRERIGDREADVVIFEPKSGSAQRYYIDTDTHLPVRVVMTVNVPQLGQDVEQTVNLGDYRTTDGVRAPFRVVTTSPVQTATIVVSTVEHNATIDAALFRRPAP